MYNPGDRVRFISDKPHMTTGKVYTVEQRIGSFSGRDGLVLVINDRGTPVQLYNKRFKLAMDTEEFILKEYCID